MMRNFKPCPLCPDGGDVAMGTYREDAEGMWSGYVECSICGVSIDDRCNSMEALESTLMERWNTRYEPTCKWSPLVPDPENPSESLPDYEGNWKSECGASHEWIDDYLPRYCPNCGDKVVR